MTGKFYKYRLYCADHDQMVETDYVHEDDGIPTKCPLNEGHTTISSISITDVLDNTIQKIKQVDTDGLDPDVAFTVEDGVEVPVESGVSPSVKEKTYSYDVDILGAKFTVDYFTEVNKGDRYDVFILPPSDGAIGAVASPGAALDETVIPVSASVLENLRHGMHVKIGTNEEEYEVSSKDETNGTITIDHGLVIAAAEGDAVYLRVPVSRNCQPMKNGPDKVGEMAHGGKFLQAGYILRLRYHHGVDPASADNLNARLVCKI